MVFGTGNYFIRFTSGSAELPPEMTQTEKEAYLKNIDYAYNTLISSLLRDPQNRYSNDWINLNQKGNERLFFDLLKEMGLEGKILLIKEENGTTSTINENSDGTTTTNPC
ncbi:hypothetical protein [Cloacibacterium sp. TD35]|uniref:hypothetical protein n=1 Tax=Cloacibacterium sp. TD35 TaxID=2976818 RepID=UPI00237D63A2|nr:hypothetical protein [Cloacibacterium sp. TD35]WDT68888.1 hypothetical protein N7277_04565 [Cloacibacterium sp. TD35]